MLLVTLTLFIATGTSTSRMAKPLEGGTYWNLWTFGEYDAAKEDTEYYKKNCPPANYVWDINQNTIGAKGFNDLTTVGDLGGCTKEENGGYDCPNPYTLEWSASAQVTVTDPNRATPTDKQYVGYGVNTDIIETKDTAGFESSKCSMDTDWVMNHANLITVNVHGDSKLKLTDDKKKETYTAKPVSYTLSLLFEKASAVRFTMVRGNVLKFETQTEGGICGHFGSIPAAATDSSFYINGKFSSGTNGSNGDSVCWTFEGNDNLRSNPGWAGEEADDDSSATVPTVLSLLMLPLLVAMHLF